MKILNYHNCLYLNNETGELLTYDQMVKEGNELYDLFDLTNGMPIEEYYTIHVE